MSSNPTSQMLRRTRRILIFSLAYYPVVGGAEIAVKEITNRISGIEFDVITLRFKKEHPEKEKIGNCTIYRINTSKNLYPFKALFYTAVIYGLISPVLIYFILRLANDKNIMGDKTNMLATNVLGIAALLVMTAAALALAVVTFA